MKLKSWLSKILLLAESFSHSNAQQDILAKYPTMNINVKEIWNIDKTDAFDGNMNACDAISDIYLGTEVSGLSNIPPYNLTNIMKIIHTSSFKVLMASHNVTMTIDISIYIYPWYSYWYHYWYCYRYSINRMSWEYWHWWRWVWWESECWWYLEKWTHVSTDQFASKHFKTNIFSDIWK